MENTFDPFDGFSIHGAGEKFGLSDRLMKIQRPRLFVQLWFDGFLKTKTTITTEEVCLLQSRFFIVAITQREFEPERKYNRN